MNPRPPHSEKRKTNDGSLALVLLLTIVLPVVYVFLCGPLAWLEDRVGGDWYDTLFAPLLWIYDHWPAVQPWLDAYINWWA